MKKPPRRSNDSLITAWIIFHYLVIGLHVGIATIGAFIIWYTHNSFLGIDYSQLHPCHLFPTLQLGSMLILEKLQSQRLHSRSKYSPSTPTRVIISKPVK